MPWYPGHFDPKRVLLPDSLEQAHKEIVRLTRARLFDQETWLKKHEKLENDLKAVRGTAAKLREENAATVKQLQAWLAEEQEKVKMLETEVEALLREHTDQRGR